MRVTREARGRAASHGPSWAPGRGRPPSPSRAPAQCLRPSAQQRSAAALTLSCSVWSRCRGAFAAGTPRSALVGAAPASPGAQGFPGPPAPAHRPAAPGPQAALSRPPPGPLRPALSLSGALAGALALGPPASGVGQAGGRGKRRKGTVTEQNGVSTEPSGRRGGASAFKPGKTEERPSAARGLRARPRELAGTPRSLGPRCPQPTGRVPGRGAGRPGGADTSGRTGQLQTLPWRSESWDTAHF